MTHQMKGEKEAALPQFLIITYKYHKAEEKKN
jgi:hypothetical protein